MISIHAPPRGATIPPPVVYRWIKYFNSRPSARGDGFSFSFPSLRQHFNSRPSARGDSERRKRNERVCNFNSRPSARGDRADLRSNQRGDGDFNSRPSARGDRIERTALLLPGRFQFTPLREGRPPSPQVYAGGAEISIHAPPRGATGRKEQGRRCRTHFNSRPSARGDLHFLMLGRRASRISIHAPPRGATPRHAGRIHPRQFQFTPLREGRLV